MEDGEERLLPAGTVLKLLVVDDSELAAAIQRLEGEWEAQAGSGIEVRESTADSLPKRGNLGADIVICPSCQIGPLAQREQIAPLPRKPPSRSGGSSGGSGSQVFNLVRSHAAAWGKQEMAVPLGTPVFTLYYRADLLELLDRGPPDTWAEYAALAEALSDRERLGDAALPDEHAWFGALEPLGAGWAGLTLLARAAPYATHRENYSTLFQIDTMEPLIEGPPFVRALEELVEAASFGASDPLAYDPAAVRAAFWAGRCGLAVTWPTAAGNPPAKGEGVVVAVAELPGSPEAYDVVGRAWEPRVEGEDPRVPLLGVGGRLGLVARESQWPEASYQLLRWLSDEQSTQVCPRSSATTLFRNAHLPTVRGWVEPPFSADAAADYAELTRTTLSRSGRLFALRIPGRNEYLAALDEAIERALADEQPPEQSLQEAATAWREITERLGPDSQRQAYRASLGIN